jgi:hypothetical protein
LNIALYDKKKDRGMTTKKIERVIDRDQLSGDPHLFLTSESFARGSQIRLYI